MRIDIIRSLRLSKGQGMLRWDKRIWAMGGFCRSQVIQLRCWQGLTRLIFIQYHTVFKTHHYQKCNRPVTCFEVATGHSRRSLVALIHQRRSSFKWLKIRWPSSCGIFAATGAAGRTSWLLVCFQWFHSCGNRQSLGVYPSTERIFEWVTRPVAGIWTVNIIEYLSISDTRELPLTFPRSSDLQYTICSVRHLQSPGLGAQVVVCWSCQFGVTFPFRRGCLSPSAQIWLDWLPGRATNLLDAGSGMEGGECTVVDGPKRVSVTR